MCCRGRRGVEVSRRGVGWRFFRGGRGVDVWSVCFPGRWVAGVAYLSICVCEEWRRLTACSVLSSERLRLRLLYDWYRAYEPASTSLGLGFLTLARSRWD